MNKRLLTPVVLVLLSASVGAEKPLEHFETYPGYGFQVFQEPEQWAANREAVIMSYSNDSVTGRSALKLTFPDCPGNPGRIVRTGTRATFEGAKAISFWIKGDGTRNLGFIATSQKPDGPRARIYLRNKRWRRVIIPWNRFQPWTDSAPVISFGLEADATRPVSYIIDKIEAVESTERTIRDTRLANAANAAKFPPDPELPATFARYISYTNTLNSAKRALKSRKPATILILGDIVATGNKLYNIDTDEKVRLLHKYPGVLGRLLGAKHGYGTASIVSETMRTRTGREVVSFGSLRIISACKDLKASAAAGKLKRELDREKPVLVVIQLGCADSLKGSTEGLRKGLTACIDLVKKRKINCLVVTNVPGYFRTAEEETFAREIRVIARGQRVALVDARKLFTGLRGNAWSVYFSDRHVPNHAGHRVIAEMIAQALK